MKRIVSRQELVSFLLGLVGATFATITTRTNARAKKTGNPHGEIHKVATVNGQLNFHYDLAVIRRLEKEGKDASAFEQGESWHRPIKRTDGTLTPLASKKGEDEPAYLRFRYLAPVVGPEYFDLAGKQLDVEEIREFLPKPSSYTNQGTDNPVVFLTYSLDSIQEIRTEGEHLIVAQE